ncbi:hypothetical protein BOX15_Mlig026510g3 [Macrostomum lignano]|uniref:RNA helicase n=2 Tax=Macrostomum lignano TaxID=282301 RepID=A0A267FE51_9PLAT|nr:hypothetical protein BOX15_Mlig026510g1 [Macrostomum lignano]PAA73695.1 hypothetical protein BOX15_Mlig026510g3 [Macrostomum lignano]
MEFESFSLNPALLSAISDLNWFEPTEIQRHVIPLILDGKNVLAWARTGSGKTGAFAVPIVEKILQIKTALPEDSAERAATRALILAPTKELCAQAAGAVAQLTAYCSRLIRCVDASAHASTDVLRPQLLERPDIVVGTPSGLLAHVNAGSLTLEPDKLLTVVVDEADLVFSFGYEEDFKQLRQLMPAKFQAILVSATLGSGDVKRLRKALLKAGVWSRVELTESALLPGPDQLLQYSVRCSEEDRFVLLYSLIKLRLIRGKSLIFVNTVDRGYRVKLFLEQFAIRSVLLNSELPLATRCHVVQQFNKGLYDILIASDRSFSDGQAGDEGDNGGQEDGSSKQKKRRVRQQGDREFGVSRGVDFQLVSNVINFELPASAKAYVHRVGRTSRAGQQGTALSFVASEQDSDKLAKIEALVGQELRPFQFRMEELDGFRYRARDAMRAVTSAAVRESRVREIRQELLNSAKLRAHFADNPRDLHLLRHDKELHTARVQAHLRHVPEYIVPDALRDIVTGGGGGHKRRRRNPRFGGGSGGGGAGKETKSGGASSTDKEIKGRRFGGSGGAGPSIPMTADQRRRQRKAADPLYSARAALQLGRRAGGSGGGAKRHQKKKPTKSKV